MRENIQIGFPTRSDTNWPVQKQARSLNFLFKKKRGCTDQLCVFVFTYADCWFSHVVAHYDLNFCRPE